MNRAGAALGEAGGILGAGQTNLLSNDPQQRSVWVHFDGMGLSVDDQPSHSPPPTVVGECRLRLRSCIACQHSLNVGALERASAQYVRDHANVSKGIMGRIGSGVCAGARWLCVLTNWLGRWRRLAFWSRTGCSRATVARLIKETAYGFERLGVCCTASSCVEARKLSSNSRPSSSTPT